MKKLAGVVFLLVFALAACSGQTPTIEPSPVISTLTPHPMLAPTSTPTFQLGRTHTMLATGIAGATQTAQQDGIDCAGHPESRRYVDDAKSPNGAWRVNLCIDPNAGYSYTEIIQVSGVTTWKASFYETFISKLKSDTVPEGFKDGQLNVIHWSGDGNYVYLYPYICCIDGPVLFNGVPALYQLDLNNGKLKDMLPSGGCIGFSPDDKYLAYRTLPATIHLRNLQTDDDSSFRLDSKYATLGVFSWSLDSQKLVFVAALEDWDKNMYMYEPTPVSKDGFSLLLLDLETMKITTLIDNDIRMLVPGSSSYYESDNAWAGNDKIYLAQMNIAGRDELKIWLYDINKRQLISFATPTPMPTP